MTRKLPSLQAIPQLFDAAQKSPVSQHRRLHAQLQKLLTQHPLPDFHAAFYACVHRLLAVRSKKEVTVERCVKFCTGFVAHLQRDGAGDQAQEFTDSFLSFLLRGLTAKDKGLRLRCCQMLALSIDSIQEMDDELFQELKEELMERMMDKEPAIRVQATIALSKFQTGDENEVDQDDCSATEMLCYMMQNDLSADVRKAALINVDINKSSIPYVVERARDVDPGIRRYVYQKAMAEIGDCRIFSLTDREQILKWGLNDRDATVRNACANMLCDQWIKQCDDNIIEFLGKLDVINGGEVAESALQSFFTTHPSLELKFDQFFWENLTPETVFLMRAYYQFCVDCKDGRVRDDVFPEVLEHTERLQKYITIMLNAEDATFASYEFIVAELLKIALLLDYSDEAGRRTTFAVLRDVLVQEAMPEKLIDLLCDVMKKLAIDERDFLRFMTEIVSQVMESLEKPENASQSVPVEALAKELDAMQLNEDSKMTLQIRAMQILTSFLARNRLTLTLEPQLFHFLLEVVVPSLTAGDADMQLAALPCLVQYCLQEKDLAIQNFNFFAKTIGEQNGEEIRKLSIKTLFDMVLLYDFDSFTDSDKKRLKLIHSLTSILEEDDNELQSIVCEGFCKLMLLKSLQEPLVLEALIQLYFHPAYAKNERMRQCLTFFFQVYAYHSTSNQAMIAKTIGACFFDILDMQQEDEEALTPALIIAQISDWINPAQVKSDKKQHLPDYNALATMALDVCKTAGGQPTAIMKFGGQLLNKIPLRSPISADIYEELAEALEDLIQDVTDRTTVNYFKKFQKVLAKCKTDDASETDPENDDNAEKKSSDREQSDNQNHYSDAD